MISSKARQYPSWYTPARRAFFSQLVGRGVFAFDCVCLIKAILWGWTGDKAKTNGGAQYASNGVPDIDANVFIQRCKNVSRRFGDARPGDALWLPGHIGIYIGDGKAVECTPAWDNGVQITAVGNIGKIAGLNTRYWEKVGTNPFIEYEEEDDMAKIMDELKRRTGMTEDQIIDTLGVVLKHANTKEDAWEKDAAAKMKADGLMSQAREGNEPVEFGELGAVLGNFEAKMDKKYKK